MISRELNVKSQLYLNFTDLEICRAGIEEVSNRGGLRLGERSATWEGFATNIRARALSAPAVAKIAV